jgi:hypothetical protein
VQKIPRKRFPKNSDPRANGGNSKKDRRLGKDSATEPKIEMPEELGARILLWNYPQKKKTPLK